MRSMPRILSSAALTAAFLAFGSGSLRAQTGATTLGELTDRADAIVVVKALRNHAADGSRRVDFRVTRVLHGETGRIFGLEEPAVRACGRALSGVVPGSSHLAFLRLTEGKAPALVATGARALPRLQPGLESHVTALVQTRSEPDERVELLANALQSAEGPAVLPRVRDDAAMDLAVHPSTTRLGLDTRRRLRGLCEADGAAPLFRLSLAQVLARFDGTDDRAVLRRMMVAEDPWIRFVGRTAALRAASTAAATGSPSPAPEEAPTFRSIRPRRKR